MSVRLAALALVAGCWGLVAHADQPPAKPASYELRPPKGTCWAYSDVVAQTTIVYGPGPKGRAKELWRVPGWHRVAALSDHCEYLMTGYDGVNLLPLDYDPNAVLMSFYRGGQLIRQVRLPELVPDLSKLRRTASHFEWGEYLGVERGKYYRVLTHDRGEVLFDMSTGQPLPEKPRKTRGR